MMLFFYQGIVEKKDNPFLYLNCYALLRKQRFIDIIKLDCSKIPKQETLNGCCLYLFILVGQTD